MKAQQSIAERVADKQYLDAGFIHEFCRGKIISGQHYDFAALRFLPADRNYGISFHNLPSFPKVRTPGSGTLADSDILPQYAPEIFNIRLFRKGGSLFRKGGSLCRNGGSL